MECEIKLEISIFECFGDGKEAGMGKLYTVVQFLLFARGFGQEGRKAGPSLGFIKRLIDAM